jgi:hypothetical protein
MQKEWYQDKITKTAITEFHMFLLEFFFAQCNMPQSIINLIWSSYKWRKAINEHLETTNQKTILKIILAGDGDILNYNSWALRYLIETNHEDLLYILIKNPTLNIHKSIKDIISSTKNTNIKNKIIFDTARESFGV